MDEMEEKKYLNIELMRFIGVLLIMGHHLYLIGFEGDYLFKNCWTWVDFFFILTGALTYRHFDNSKDEAGNAGTVSLRYTFRKYGRFFILTVISVICMVFLCYGYMLFNHESKAFLSVLTDSVFEMLFLSSSRLTPALNAPIWFLSASFIVLPIICYMIQVKKELWKVLSLLIPILYFGYFGVNSSRAWPNDLLRATACISLGTLAYIASAKIREKFSGKKVFRIVLSVSEILAVIISAAISIIGFDAVNILELLFLIIIILMLSGVTVSFRIKGRIPAFLGKMSMPMFIFHWVIGYTSTYMTGSIPIRTGIFYFGTMLLGAAYVLAVTGGKHVKNR